MTKYISYIRVSTEQQGRSGLGLKAQNQAVEAYVLAQAGELVAVFREVMSGAKVRPGLTAAVAEAKAQGAVIVFAKLDRLARDVVMIKMLIKSGVDLVFLDVPGADTTTASGRLMVGMMAEFAEFERDRIGERIRDAIAQLPPERHPGRISERRALAGYQEAKPVVVAFLAEFPDASLRAVARRLNGLGIKSPTGGYWHPSTTGRLLAAVAS